MARRLAFAAVGFVLLWGCGGKKADPAGEQRTGKQAEYAAAGSCAECHAAQAKTHAETGMGRAFARATEASAGREFAGAGVFYHKASERYYQPLRREGRFFLRRWQKDEGGGERNAIEYEVHYVVGSGNHSKTFLHRDGANHLIEMPVSWYADGGGKWAMSPGYDNAAHYDFRRKINYDCFFCHNGYPGMDAGMTGAGAEPVYPGELPEGIDCQRCHGPGAAHVSAAKKKAAPEELKKLIVHPGRLPAERRMEVCLQCHLETTSFPLPNAIQRYGRGAFTYRPGEPLQDYMLHFDHAKGTGREEKFEIASAAYRLRQSECFVKSGAKMQCTTCHDPHQAKRGAEAVAAYAAVCRGCHETALKKLVAAGRHTGKQECAGCHMPKRRTEDVVHVVMTDHKIARRPPAGNLLAARAERLETAGVSYRGEVAPYYPAGGAAAGESANAEEELYRAVAQVLQKSNLEAGIARLEAAVKKHAPKGPAFYFDLAEAYLAAGKRAEAMAGYEAALKQDAAFAPAMRGLGGALLQQNDLGRAIPLLEKARGLDERDAPTLQALGRAYQQQGRMTEAVAALRAAVEVEPVDAGIRELLGNALMAAGDAAGAEASFRAAILHQPDLATAHYGYAATLAARGQFEEAEPEMRRAVALGPGLAQPREMLGNLYARKKRWALAREQYGEALRIDPRLGRAHLGMAMVMGSMGDFAAAKRHLQEAAASGDAAVAADARELLGALP
ncbi:MAG: tetratricopeptide repeat protein [Acidobacteria bacterium]|nr:tetratricopeptide repeat protein [Acidobacteriota bacterium]